MPVANGQARGEIFDVKRYSVHDGPGIRTTVFFTGCPLNCWWCHNPEGLRSPAASGKMAGESLESEGIERGFAGTVTVSAVMEEVLRDRVYYDQSGGGVTFSGGEPLMQPDFLTALLKASREEGLHTAVDTSGFASEAVLRSIMPLVDVFLFDLKLMDGALHKKYTGVSNESILANLKLLAGTGCAVQLRLPVIPGITDTQANLDAVAGFALEHMKCRRISLLPYHRTAEAKYARLGLENRMQGTKPPSNEHMGEVRRHFEEQGFEVRIGG